MSARIVLRLKRSDRSAFAVSYQRELLHHRFHREVASRLAFQEASQRPTHRSFAAAIVSISRIALSAASCTASQSTLLRLRAACR